MLRQGCSMSMLHRTCEKLYGVLGWVDWVWPIYCVCLFILSQGVLRSALDRVERRLSKPIREESTDANNQGTVGAKTTTNEVKSKGHIIIPYTQGLCKSIKKICSRYSLHTYFKGNSTIKNLLVPPRTRNPWKIKVGPSTGSNVGTLHVMRNT